MSLSDIGNLRRRTASSVSSSPSTSSSSPIVMPIQTLTPVSAENRLDMLNNPVINALRSTPGMNRFLTPELIPDLLYIVEKEGLDGLIKLAGKVGVNEDPEYIIFKHQSQEVHAKTEELEKQLILNTPDVEENENVQCSNRRCGSRKVLVTTKQTRSADEPMSLLVFCTICKRGEMRRQ